MTKLIMNSRERPVIVAARITAVLLVVRMRAIKVLGTAVGAKIESSTIVIKTIVVITTDIVAVATTAVKKQAVIFIAMTSIVRTIEAASGPAITSAQAAYPFHCHA